MALKDSLSDSNILCLPELILSVPFVSSSVNSVVKGFNKLKRLISILLSATLLNTISLFSQDMVLSESILTIAEELAADDSDPEVVGLYIEKLYELLDDPADINSNDPDELNRLFFLSDFQIKVIADYTSKTGKILSPYEIANLPGFDRETAMMLEAFINLKEKAPPYYTRPEWHNSLVTNLTRRTTDNDSLWQGSADKILTRYRFSAGGLSGGFTAEKDQGERLLQGTPPMPDMLSAYFSYKGKGILRNFVIGDYSARFGQGTNINTGIRNYISLHAPGYMSSRNEIRPYTSADENSFFRGAGAEFSLGKISFMLICSSNKIDATTAMTHEGNEYVESLYTSGLHNTVNSLKKKDVLGDKVFGANILFNNNNFRMGFSLSEEKFTLPFLPDVNDPEKVYRFRGDNNSLYSAYYSTMTGKMLFFGEITLNKAFKHAFIQGITMRPSDRLSVNFLFRDYENGFNAFHGKGPGSSQYSHRSLTGNFMLEAVKHVFLTGGCEITEYPWLRYNVSSPSHSMRNEIRMRFTKTENFIAEAVYSNTISTKDEVTVSGVPETDDRITRNFNASLKYSASEKITFRTRVYHKITDSTSDAGTMLVQDMNYSFHRIPLSIWLRFSAFSTESWDSRIYVYENDLLYTFSIPAIYGRGSRNYLMISWKIKKKAELRFKYGIQSKSGDAGKTINTEDFRLQFRLAV